MSHLCLIALVCVLFVGFAEVHCNTHTVQIEVEGNNDPMSIDVPVGANVSDLVAKVNEKLAGVDIKAIHEKTVRKSGKNKGKEKLGNILGGKKSGKKSADKIKKVYVKVKKAKAKGGKNAHEMHGQEGVPEAGAGDAHNPRKNSFALLSEDNGRPVDNENDDSRAAIPENGKA
ncbi:hypothetical protein DdX_13667 [Ditylenchus destructor]|uniref:Uncharacterized protein n=1 Tax=Ditylenchus destructor TaxID=166010 RepID=A0AAD4R2M4_9BILA|nr:hypothetical protein DdX_13667 [Ditylenchus destructor]